MGKTPKLTDKRVQGLYLSEGTIRRLSAVAAKAKEARGSVIDALLTHGGGCKCVICTAVRTTI